MKALVSVCLLAVLLPAAPFAQSVESRPANSGLELLPLAPRVAMHTSFKRFTQFFAPANGLALQTEQGAVLIDATWSEREAKRLFREVKRHWGRPRWLLLTHAHEDRAGGLGYFLRRGVKVIAWHTAADQLQAQGYPRPHLVLTVDTLLQLGGVDLEIAFPGAGHAPGNLTVWLPQTGILFGGCLVKSAAARLPGHTEHADLALWREALHRTYLRYAQARIVVPGHGPCGGAELLRRSDQILIKAQKVRQAQQAETEGSEEDEH